uniref:Ion transporter n=1 Tax=Thermocrispum agreste TaxID=37925 RepID=A0A2W4IQP8_9PSEU|nr:MAG: ion transporter [Thermocrispum agreste]
MAGVVGTPLFPTVNIRVILFNGIPSGVGTAESIMAGRGDLLHVLDKIVLAIFVAELVAKLVAFGPRFFSDGWNVFDLVVVVIALVPASGPFAVLRALRVLRVLRLISAVPAMRKVVSGLLSAIPGMASIVALLGLVLFVSAVMATNLFRDVAPQYFGDLGTSLFALFQIMTGESWPDIADAVMAEMPLAWIFFVIYILISTFAVLNLFIAVVVNAMEAQLREEMHQEGEQHHQELADSNATILAELQALRAEVAQLRAGLDGQRVSATDGAN